MLIFLAHERTKTIAPITMATYPDGNAVELPGNTYRVFGGQNLKNKRAEGVQMRRNHFYGCPDASKYGGNR